VGQIVGDVETRGDDLAFDADVQQLKDLAAEAPVIRLVSLIITNALEARASDIHFEPFENRLVVRYRIDGVLRVAESIPIRLASGVTTRLKVLAKLDIAERRKPQDGRISLGAKVLNRALDIRVAVLPTVEGEAVVLRLLDKSRRPPTLEELGFSPDMRSVLEAIVRKPTGALLVTGPTGSGKSTTLYAVLNAIHRPEINIITVEDPVEYRLAGVQQVQMNPKAQLTFASALRTILRSDPDVIMVGEIRDIETAKISIEAALTGHFVLSTLHTNDAPSALTRLNEMGVEPFLTGSAVTAVLAQRLARRLCSVCCEAYTPTREELVAARFTPEQIAAADGAPLYRRKGCPRCNHTGYKGRLGVFQLMVMGEELERLASERANRELIEQAAREGGMRGMWDDGLEKVLQGMTTVEELGRVLV
jgi:type IV pilus assembly protein PilB